jgi:hypothetical protein
MASLRPPGAKGALSQKQNKNKLGYGSSEKTLA